MNERFFVTVICCCFFYISNAQNKQEYKTWNPALDTIQVMEGRGWPCDTPGFYNRLPGKAEQLVRKEVWSLSKNSAGLQLRFQTNAEEIVVKYIVTGTMQMYHMPLTGVSGIDLYSKTIDGNWLWASGRYSFGDTVVCRYTNLVPNDQHVPNREYSLYLPLYNSVKWMEISVPKERVFKPLKVRTEKPVVVYGTSIAQGACASRPGLAWTNILGRKLERPVINLGFSGNGRLEKELIDLLTEVDAELYVLDCLPNLTAGYLSTGELKQRITDAISVIQKKRSGVPVLLTEHDGYTDEGLNPVRRKEYRDVNQALKEVMDSLQLKGVKNIYRLSKEEINQDIETMVDGVHPNDIGMMRYAEAYEKKIRGILNEPSGSIATTIPVTQRRDANTYDWETRHNAIMAYNKENPPQLVFIGNSITHYWGGLPAAPRVNGKESWEKYFASKQLINMGFGWDRIENVLWRVYHGELDHISPKQIVLMIGTNNLQYNNDQEIVEGLGFLVKAIQTRLPTSEILLMGIFPRRGMEERITVLNRLIAKASPGLHVKYADAGKLLVTKDKKIKESLFSDGLHPNETGYEKIGAFISMQLQHK